MYICQVCIPSDDQDVDLAGPSTMLLKADGTALCIVSKDVFVVTCV
jgi:hypothetical protein